MTYDTGNALTTCRAILHIALLAIMASLASTAQAASGDKPIARFVVLSNPYVTALPAGDIKDDRGENRGWLASVAKASLAQNVQLINKLSPDGVIIMGSLTWSGSEADFAVFDEIIKQVKAPVMLTAGLRDAPQGDMQAYRSRFAGRAVDQTVQTVKGVRLIFAGGPRDADASNAVISQLRAQAVGDAKATLLFTGDAGSRVAGASPSSQEEYWQFVDQARVAVRFDATRNESRMGLQRNLPIYTVGSTGWSLRNTITQVSVHEDRIVVEKLSSMNQQSMAVEFPNPVTAPRLTAADEDPHGCPSYTADLAAKPGLTFAVISDPQLSARRNTDYLVKQTRQGIDEINRLKPAHVFIPGDLIESNFPEDWELYKKTFASLSIPSTVMPGNHDVLYLHDFVEDMYNNAKKNNPANYERVSQAAQAAVDEGHAGPLNTALFRKHTGSPVRQVVTLGDCVFICMEILTKRIEPDELAWLRQQLEKAASAKHVFVLGHYPVLPAFGNNVAADAGGDEMLKLLDEFKVVAFIFGHRHRPGFGMHGKTAHVLCDNMRSIVLVHVFDDHVVIGRKALGSPVYEKVRVAEPRAGR